LFLSVAQLTEFHRHDFGTATERRGQRFLHGRRGVFENLPLGWKRKMPWENEGEEEMDSDGSFTE